ncbi:hypothetical protein D3C76_766500 [compost metagenome]
MLAKHDCSPVVPLLHGDRSVVQQAQKVVRVLGNCHPKVIDCGVEVIDMNMGRAPMEKQLQRNPSAARVWLQIVAALQSVQLHHLGNEGREASLAARVTQWGIELVGVHRCRVLRGVKPILAARSILGQPSPACCTGVCVDQRSI